MIINTAFARLIGCVLVVAASSASADTGKTTGTGANDQRDANGEIVVAGSAPSMAIGRPTVRDRGVFIAQVGTENHATVTQTAPVAVARIDQNGDRNRAFVAQRGAILAYADLRQSGMFNDATVTQGGSGGEAVLFATQAGTGNRIHSDQQSSDGGANAAALVQVGNGNLMALAQSGEDNLAQLTQDGDTNQMTASQSGAGNRLIWTQQGNGLSNLAIAQSGGQSLQVTQSR